MKVECVHCGASGQMDETRIPAGVTSIRCPRCKESFPIPAIIGNPDSAEPEEAVKDKGGSPSPPVQPHPLHEAAAQVSPPSAPPLQQTLPDTQTAVAEMANCTVCAGRFPRNEMVRFGTSWVCAACKPGYVQMLAQGRPRLGELRYAGFWIRFGAKLLDWLILGVVNFLVGLVLGFMAPKTSPMLVLAYSIVLYILQIGIAAAYSGYFLSAHRATPGKMACGLQVVSPQGGQISVMRGVGRYFAEILSGMVLMIGYLMVPFDDEKRALHDRICDTRVVYQ